jgi:hypothetical protein
LSSAVFLTLFFIYSELAFQPINPLSTQRSETMGILLVLSVLILIYFPVVLTEKSSIHYFLDSSDEEVLLKMARDFRYV